MKNSPELSSRTPENKLRKKLAVATLGVIALGASLGIIKAIPASTSIKAVGVESIQPNKAIPASTSIKAVGVESIQPSYARGTSFEKDGYLPIDKFEIKKGQSVTLFARCPVSNYQECLDHPFDQGSKKSPEIIVDNKTTEILYIAGDRVSDKFLGIPYFGPFLDISTVPAGTTYRNSSPSELSQIMTVSEDRFPGAYSNGATMKILSKFGETVMTQELQY